MGSLSATHVLLHQIADGEEADGSNEKHEHLAQRDGMIKLHHNREKRQGKSDELHTAGDC